MAFERLTLSVEMQGHRPCAKKQQNLVPGARIELATPAFSGRRSTNELPRLFNNLQSANVGGCYCGARNPASELSREFFVELSMLMASANNLRLKNYNGSIAPSQLADAPARDGYSAWSWQETVGP